MQEALLPGAKVELPEHFAAFDVDAGARPAAAGATLRAALRLHAASRIARRLAQLKEQAGTFGFADMLARLDKALDEPSTATTPTACASASWRSTRWR